MEAVSEAIFSLFLVIGSSFLTFGKSSLDRVIHISLVSIGIIIILNQMQNNKTCSWNSAYNEISQFEKLKSSVCSKNGRISLGIRAFLSFFSELPFPELALEIDLSKDSIILFGMVALSKISLQVRVKTHGQGQSSSGPAGGSREGSAGGSGGGGGDENGTIDHGEGRSSDIAASGQGQGNGDDDDNHDRRKSINVVWRPRSRTPEEIAVYLSIIIQSIASIMGLNVAELSNTGRAILYFSMIINLVGFLCCAAVLWQPYTNPRVANILDTRISEILSRVGSGLAVLGFISMTGIDLPLYLGWIVGLAFLVVLAFFLADISDISEAR